MRELVELLPGGFHASSDSHFKPPPVESCIKHVTQLAEGSYHLQLIRSYLNVTLRSAVNKVGISPASCTSIIKSWCQLLEPAAFLMLPEFAATTNV